MRFLKYFGLALILQVVFLIAYLAIHPEGDVPTDFLVFMFYLWPLLLLPTSGGGHGGELLFAPITIFIHSLVFAKAITFFKKQ